MSIALISDAGTPLISDPGFSLVQRCIEKKIDIDALPGASSILPALSLSGFCEKSFAFWGFIPKKEGEKRSFLQKALFFSGASICFETPHRIIDTLQMIDEIDPLREVCIAREISKKFQEHLHGSARDHIEHFTKKTPKGEIVIVLGKGEMETCNIPTSQLIEMLQSIHGLSISEAIKESAKLKKIPKKSVYKTFHNKDGN